jgi:hypothetical protein
VVRIARSGRAAQDHVDAFVQVKLHQGWHTVAKYLLASVYANDRRRKRSVDSG